MGGRKGGGPSIIRRTAPRVSRLLDVGQAAKLAQATAAWSANCQMSDVTDNRIWAALFLRGGGGGGGLGDARCGVITKDAWFVMAPRARSNIRIPQSTRRFKSATALCGELEAKWKNRK